MTLQYETNLPLPDTLMNLDERLKVVEERFAELGFDMKAIVATEVKRTWRVDPQSTTMYGMTTALCVATVDPWKQNRVRFYTPLLHDPDTEVQNLPFAAPISPMGGIDDSGMSWVPPAGSTLCILFEQGARWSPYYMGTTWSRNRGPAGKHTWNFPMPEYDKVSAGHRKGYTLAPDDESQVLPPWNTESSNGNDINNIGQFENDPDAKKKITTPHIYGFKTPEKHMLKMVDGDPKCDRRWKRLEILSGGKGGWLMMKDDHMRPSGQWAHPECSCGGGDLSDCAENPDNDCDKPKEKPKCANPYFKHKNECWPYKGPGTPQNNKAALDQSGVQLLSGSGQTLILDDSVEQPRGKPTWERSMQAFDFGCSDLFKGKLYCKSATGHEFGAYDDEAESKLRSDQNGIKFSTATGNLFFMNDHTVKGEAEQEEGGGEEDGEGGEDGGGGEEAAPSQGSGSKRAGRQRGILMQSTSNHVVQLCDWDNEQSSPERAAGGAPVNKAKKAYVLVRSGYGLQMFMGDRKSQQNTDTQFINILCPMKDNKKSGPHMIHMQEAKEGPGVVYLRAGGYFVIDSHDAMLDIVGTKDNPADKITVVTDKYIINTKDIHYHYSGKSHIFMAEEKMFLLAGRDCDLVVDDGGGESHVEKKVVPCVYNVVINRNTCKCPVFQWMEHFTPGRSTSERVFASGYSSEDSSIPCGGAVSEIVTAVAGTET